MFDGAIEALNLVVVIVAILVVTIIFTLASPFLAVVFIFNKTWYFFKVKQWQSWGKDKKS